MTSPSVLDIELRGDPGTCRSTAAWFTRKATDVTDAADALVQARAQSERCWRGDSGDAFRTKMGDAQGEVDELSVQFERAGRALHDFADSLDTVRSRLDQARTIAAAAGLQVTDTYVLPPEPPTSAPPVNPPDPR